MRLWKAWNTFGRSRLRLWALGALVAMVALGGCGGGQPANTAKPQTPAEKSGSPGAAVEKPPAAGEPIKIGAFFSASGGAAPLGKPELDTVKMLVDELNQKGGIGGRPVELIAYDDKSDQNEAVLAVKKLIESDKVAAIVGGTISGNSLAVIPQVEKAGVPYLSVAASRQVARPDDGSPRKWTFKTAQGDDIVIDKVLEFLKEQNLTKIAWLNVANAYGSSGRAEFERLAPNYGIEAVAKEEFEATVNDAKAMLTRVKKANPQAIVVWGTVQESAVVTKNIRELGFDVPVIESHGIGNPQFIQLAGEAAENVVFPIGRIVVADQLPDSDPQKATLLEYKKAYEAKYGTAPSTFGGHAWDAFQILVAAIEKAGTDPVAIRDAIEGTKNFVGITGVFNFSPDDHTGLTKDSLVIARVKNGAFEFVHP
ncbi:ABC transporter substrate-binding protein [Hydrogenibacillus sp. N12]|uniref:ABC transporter substrate-binding protein n=1 Tax=Hydrogenibacillus sp. N12 TaxID=2866627 RepID=UPI00207BFE45|nr:ABC transporter substrate-binding protein [Hydrogenibacillus sp. N12]